MQAQLGCNGFVRRCLPKKTGNHSMNHLELLDLIGTGWIVLFLVACAVWCRLRIPFRDLEYLAEAQCPDGFAVPDRGEPTSSVASPVAPAVHVVRTHAS